MNDTERQDTTPLVDRFCATAGKFMLQLDSLREEIERNAGTPKGEAYARYAQRLIPPGLEAWWRIADILEDATNDPEVSANPVAVQFLRMVKSLAVDGWGRSSVAEVLVPLVKRVKSEIAGRNASQKNHEPRAWVVSEWEKRIDKSQSKASFATQYAPLGKKKFNNNNNFSITADTIKRDWLPKIKK